MTTISFENIKNPTLREFAEKTAYYKIENGLYMDEVVWSVAELEHFIEELHRHNIRTVYLHETALNMDTLTAFARHGFNLKPQPVTINLFAKGDETVLVVECDI